MAAVATLVPLAVVRRGGCPGVLPLRQHPPDARRTAVGGACGRGPTRGDPRAGRDCDAGGDGQCEPPPRPGPDFADTVFERPVSSHPKGPATHLRRQIVLHRVHRWWVAGPFGWEETGLSN